MKPRILDALLRPSSGDLMAGIANLFIRIAYGVLVLVIHGWHKTLDGLAYFKDGTEWPLAREVREMGVPAPTANAVFATLVQLLAPLFILAGFGTRPAAALLAAVLAGAVGQNLHAGRDPQLALLYSIVAVTLTIWGSGRFSIDAALRNRRA